jgi:chromosome segregation ATPase
VESVEANNRIKVLEKECQNLEEQVETWKSTTQSLTARVESEQALSSQTTESIRVELIKSQTHVLALEARWKDVGLPVQERCKTVESLLEEEILHVKRLEADMKEKTEALSKIEKTVENLETVLDQERQSAILVKESLEEWQVMCRMALDHISSRHDAISKIAVAVHNIEGANDGTSFFSPLPTKPH